jgi:glutamine amidotransferase
MIAIVDYGMGNLRSVEKAFEKLGVPTCVTSTPEEVAGANAVVVPGVGAFGDAMHELEKRNLTAVVTDQAARGIPLLGICLGQQVFFEESEESPGIRGLGLLSGKVKRFPKMGLKVPHMGWNSLTIREGSRLFDGIPDGSFFYFVHSYYVEAQASECIAAWCEYGIRFTAAVEKDNIFGVQFHPEKSQKVGLQVLANFARIAGIKVERPAI